MSQPYDIDLVLSYLGPRGCFQIWQMMFISIGGICAQFQLFDVIFIGKDIPFHCASPPPNATRVWEPDDVTGNLSSVRYEQCRIVVTTNLSDDVREQSYDCVYGYVYDWPEDASFVSEFGLVCDGYLLVSLSQTLVVLGQGIGAFVASVISDRLGRKGVLVGSQLGLLLVGVAIGASPSYPALAVFKLLVGTFQQGVVTGLATMGIELFPREQRSLCALIINVWWAAGACSMGLFAYVLRHRSWRVLQYTLSSASLLVVLLQVCFVEESLRWLVANGKKRQMLLVLTRAARANKKDVNTVLQILRQCQHDSEGRLPLLHEDAAKGGYDSTSQKDRPTTLRVDTADGEGLTRGDSQAEATELSLKATRQLTLLDIFRHSRMRLNTLITFLAWFTVAFVVFTLYLMSTSFAGDPYLNYFLTALMELPPAILLFLGVDRLGRKLTVQSFYALAGVGCIASAICRIFTDSAALGTMSTVFAMVGMVGGSGAFGGLFLYTPEYYPTNFRNQAVGTGSTVGRIGGMIAPFMKNLALVVVWGPGIITGSLCALVLLCLRMLPETQGKALPMEMEDIEAWYTEEEEKKKRSKDSQQTAA